MAKKIKQEHPLLDAVNFVRLALKDKGAENEVFCMVANGQIASFNGVIALGTRIHQSLQAAPHNVTLAAALAGCDPLDMQITQVEGDRLHVRSGAFQAFVPCCPAERVKALVWPVPDAARTPVNDSLRTAISTVGILANARAATVLAAAIVLNSGACIATNNAVILEVWHGFAMRDGIQIPKIAQMTLAKIKKPLVGFGWSDISCTFYFADNSWMKTMCYSEENMDVRKLLDKGVMLNAAPPPPGFFEATRSLLPFASDRKIYCDTGTMTAYNGKEMSSERTYKVDGAPANLAFDGDNLVKIAPFVQTIDFRGLPNAAMFYGEKLRGAIAWLDTMPKVEVKAQPTKWNEQQYAYTPITEDDIPF